MKINPYTMARIFLFGIAVFIAACLMTSCGAMQKVINKNKSETKTQTETKSATTTTASNTETTAITRTITEEFKDSVTTPIKSVTITNENKVIAKGDTITGEAEGFKIKEYINSEGKVVTEIKTLPTKIPVSGKRTIIENVNSVKANTVTSKNNQEIKQSIATKKKEYSKEVRREGINLNYLWWLLLLLLIPIWKYRKYLLE